MKVVQPVPTAFSGYRARQSGKPLTSVVGHVDARNAYLMREEVPDGRPPLRATCSE